MIIYTKESNHTSGDGVVYPSSCTISHCYEMFWTEIRGSSTEYFVDTVWLFPSAFPYAELVTWFSSTEKKENVIAFRFKPNNTYAAYPSSVIIIEIDS